jgi:hypothetical protein
VLRRSHAEAEASANATQSRGLLVDALRLSTYNHEGRIALNEAGHSCAPLWLRPAKNDALPASKPKAGVRVG